jgi:hypothetical protein
LNLKFSLSSSSSASKEKEKEKGAERKADELMNAVYRNDVNSVRSLVRAGVNPAARDSLALQVAAAGGRVDIVKLLFQDARVDPSTNDWRALFASTQNGHVAVVDRCCKTRASIRRRETTLPLARVLRTVTLPLSSDCCKTRASTRRQTTTALSVCLLRTDIRPLSSDCCEKSVSIRQPKTA